MNTSQSIFPMNDQHRATDSEWHCLEARTCGDKADVVAYSCILELRDRIKALEAAQPAKSNHPAKLDSSLVERVAEAMQPGTFDWSAYEGEARAAIRAIAAWLREQRPWGVGLWPSLLEQEAER